jgi:hypothetical protein
MCSIDGDDGKERRDGKVIGEVKVIKNIIFIKTSY